MIYDLIKPYGFEKEVVKDGTKIHRWNKFESINPPVQDKGKVDGIAVYVSQNEDDVAIVIACDSGYFSNLQGILSDKFVETLKTAYDFNLEQGMVMKGLVTFFLRSNGFGNIAGLDI